MIKLMKKEFYEFLKTKKLIAIIAVFIFFAISSPIMAKIMPEFLKTISSGITIIVPPPTWKDAFLQFFKNLNQMIFLILVLIFIGSIAEEKNRRTASLIVSRGIDRRVWVLSKFTFQLLLTISLSLSSFFICYYYSVILFPDTEFFPSFSSLLLFLVYITFVISLTIFSSSAGNNIIQAGGIFISVFILLNILNIFPPLKPYNPVNLSSMETQWIVFGVDWNSAVKTVISSLILSIVSLVCGMLYFNYQELE